GNIGFTAHNCDVVATTYIQNAIRKDANDEWEKIVGTQAQWSSATDATNASNYVTNSDTWTFGSIYFDDWFEDVATVLRIKVVISNYSLFPVSARVKTLSVAGTPVADFDNIYETDNYALVALHNDYIRAATKSGDTITPFEDQMVIEITLLDHQESFDLQAFSFGVEFAQTETPSVEDGYIVEDLYEDGTMILTQVPSWKSGSSKHFTIPNQVIDSDGNLVDVDYIYSDDTLSGITGYTTVTLSDGLDFDSFSEYELAFDSLRGVLLAESVYQLCFTFSGCNNLISLTIPANVASFRNYIYDEDTASLECISEALYVEEGNTMCYSKNNCIIRMDGTLYQGCHNSIIPSSVTTIGELAFARCEKLTTITIPTNVTSIGRYAFDNCNDLTSITIPSSVTSIGESAFNCCPNLTIITIPSSVTSIGGSAFDGCESLTSITFQGTKAEWNAIEFGDDWNDYTGDYTIHCTDGDIAKE
ncbi:MAG: leucine-rich repeat domain-containing protein, partial [Clostridiales bacterium]|nr:leucine-rich repeat domain-containing protein [Clostridiales bacterium]